MTENRDFKGVWIPKEVWLDNRLNAIEKIIFVEIDSLDSTEKGCWASNEYIAKFCQCSERTVSGAISKLTNLGYIYVQSFNGRQRELKSKYTKLQGSNENFAKQGRKNCEAETQDLRQSNTFNNTHNNTSKNNIGKSQKHFTPPTVDEVKAYCQERQNNVDPEHFIDYYTSNGWLVGKNKMKDWKAAVRTWERNNYNNKAGKTYGKNGIEIKATKVDDLEGIF